MTPVQRTMRSVRSGSIYRLTPAQYAMLNRLSVGPIWASGSAKRRVANRLRDLGLVEFTFNPPSSVPRVRITHEGRMAHRAESN